MKPAAVFCSAEIVDRDTNPKIKGTRITVYTILEYLIGAWSKEQIAELLELPPDQVQAAIDYIAENDLEVLRAYLQILERIRRGNPPELQAKLDANHLKFRSLVAEIQDAKAKGASSEMIHDLMDRFREVHGLGGSHARNHGGQ